MAKETTAAPKAPAAPKPAAKAQPKPHVAGLIYMLPKEFYVDLQDGHYAKLTLGLEVSKKDPESIAAPAGETNATSPKGYGVMPEEGVVRDIVTADLTGLTKADLLSSSKRKSIKAKLAK